MKKYFKIAAKFMNLNLQTQMAYRANFFVSILSTMTYFITMLYGLKFVYAKTPTIMGFDYEKLLVLLLLSQMWFYLYMMTARINFDFIGKSINNGGLDMLLLKPMRTRTVIPFLRAFYRHLPTLTFCTILLSFQVYEYMTPVKLFFSTIFFFMGVFITYSFLSILTTFNFWIGRNAMLFEFISESAAFIKIPVAFIPTFLRGILTFINPTIVISNPVFQIIYGDVQWSLIFSTIFVAVSLFVISEIFWKIGIKNYSSAN